MSRLISRSESWERVYQSFSNINFAAFDYDTVKSSIIDYIKLYFPETFNDFIESSEFIAIVEAFAYFAELMAYRLDVNAHENFMSTAQRKDSILRLAKLVSYTASRMLPARGLVKITSVATTESIIDANGNDLAGRTIRWNDVSNSNWKDQFVIVMNRVLEQEFGSVGPTDRFQIQDVLFELYSWNLVPLLSGVFSYSANVNGQTVSMELVPVAHDNSQGIVERRPQNNTNFTFLYGQDGLGDASETTGFFCYTKQGTLQRYRTTFDGVTPNQTYDINSDNINDTDVWINNVDSITGATLDTPSSLARRRVATEGKTGEWVEVDMAHAQSVIFNTNPKRGKYELETRANNRVRVIFGDGEFADVPSGSFDIWARSSVDQDIVVPQAAVVNAQSSFTYVDTFGRTQTFTFTYSLINSLQNASASETLEHIRATAPAAYYAQDRMVNNEDYNVFMLQDPSILKLRSINRTFAGDSKYITWHDASGTYENIKIFSDDGRLYFENRSEPVITPAVDISVLISTYIEPLLSSTDIFLQVVSAGVALSSYRRIFSATEKDRITAALTPPPIPAKMGMYYCTQTFTYSIFAYTQNEWYCVRDSDNITDIFGPGWESKFIPSPLIKVNQTSIFETRYVVARLAKRLIIESSTTSFWNTNNAAAVIDYNTLNSNNDQIIVLKANTNYNRNAILTSDWRFNVLGLETIESGSDAGLPDINRLSIMPTDLNQDGIPDNLTPSDASDPMGVADIMMPKYDLDLDSLTIPPITGLIQTLPINIIVDPTTLLTPDLLMSATGTVFTQGVDWVAAVDSGQFVTNKITLYSQGIPPASVASIAINDFVYFTRATPVDPWVAAPTSSESMNEFVQDLIVGVSADPTLTLSVADAGAAGAFEATRLWKRHQGRADLNFSWFHFSPRYHLVDPSPSNLIDTFIITKGYYASLKRWLEDPLSLAPSVPTPLDLRTSYGYLLNNGMISDEVILHPGKIKLLFGSKAAPALQLTLKVIRSADRTLTDNQIKTTIVTTIRNFFDITLWEFGETFYFTEMVSAIHAALPTEISSCVPVPTLARNQFGDLFQVLAREDEIFYPDITVDNIEIVTGYTPTNLRLNG